MYVIRRVSGNLRKDGKLWTFLYLSDPFQNFEQTGYISDTPNNALRPISTWLTEAMEPIGPQDHFQLRESDGFGRIVKILRDIKSSCKLLLGGMEDCLEDLVRQR